MGQNYFGVKFDLGMSKISNQKWDPKQTSVYFMPSGNIGIYNRLSVSNKSSIVAELLLSQIEGKEIQQMPNAILDQNGNVIGVSYTPMYLRKWITYISLPIYYGFSIKKLTLCMGAQVSCAVSNFSKASIDGSNKQINWYSRRLNISNFDYGLKFEVNYSIFKRIDLHANYYFGVKNIYNQNNLEWKIQQVTLGIKYRLIKSNLKKENG